MNKLHEHNFQVKMDLKEKNKKGNFMEKKPSVAQYISRVKRECQKKIIRFRKSKWMYRYAR